MLNCDGRIRPPADQAKLGIRNGNKAKQHRPRRLIGQEGPIDEAEAASDQQPSARPSGTSGIRSATVKQLIDALVVKATGKADFEIADIVSEITKRLNELKEHGKRAQTRNRGGSSPSPPSTYATANLKAPALRQRRCA